MLSKQPYGCGLEIPPPGARNSGKNVQGQEKSPTTDKKQGVRETNGDQLKPRENDNRSPLSELKIACKLPSVSKGRHWRRTVPKRLALASPFSLAMSTKLSKAAIAEYGSKSSGGLAKSVWIVTTAESTVETSADFRKVSIGSLSV